MLNLKLLTGDVKIHDSRSWISWVVLSGRLLRHNLAEHHRMITARRFRRLAELDRRLDMVFRPSGIFVYR